jgi:transmembrane sensor
VNRFEKYTQQTAIEAGEWLARLQSDDRSASDEAAFRLWLSQDPSHGCAFEDATNVWERLGAAVAGRRGGIAPKKPVVSRRAMMAGLGGLAIGAGGLVLSTSTEVEAYQTVVGEQRHVPLSDGTELLIDTDTKLFARLGTMRRSLELVYGRIHCRVAGNGVPFSIGAAGKSIVGRQFTTDVSFDNQRFMALLLKGQARVEGAGQSAVAMLEGDRLTEVANHSFVRDRPRISALVAWQNGRLVFENETVGHAIAQMNRYSSVKLEVDDPDIAQDRISGSYSIGNSYSFAASLSRILPIRVEQSANQIKLVKRRDI